VILLFTDGLSNAKKAREAMDEAQARGVAIHTLLLGSSKKGTAILRELAEGTGASFVRVTDPAKLPQAFLNLRTTGVDSVSLRVNDSPPIPTQLIAGTFSGQVPLRIGENRLVATALSLDGETQTDALTVVVSGPIDFAIYTPEDGALVESRKTETLVGGVVDSLVGLPAEATRDYFRLGVESVVLSVNDSPPSAATVEDGRFEGRVRLHEGENRIVAVATTRDGRTATDEIAVTVQVPGCAELHVTAVSNGRPTLSVSDRAVEIVVDASNSMWGQLDGRAKIEVAKEILQDALGWLPEDLMLALRVYGHQHKRELRVCTDSELLVPFGSGSRGRIRDAIATFRPKGQTPLAYSLKQVAADFGEFQGERAAVLVTDGIESCGGNPVEAARTLQERENVPVHVIGFGLGTEGDEDLASLQAIADASGGRFLTARSAQELRDALSVTVGTPFHVFRGQTVVGHGALGDARPMLLPEGDYRLRLDSAPPREVLLTLEREEGLTLVLERKETTVSYVVERGRADYTPCEPTATALDDDGVPGEAEQQGAAKPLAP
jgi:Mg-chelatase subunit ChlD